jgi:hypothetical protein
MISFHIILFILVVHWLADFCLQTNDQALMKSTDMNQLSWHVLTYSAVWLLMAYVLFGDWWKAGSFAMITCGAHWLTDFATSRVSKKYWERKELHDGFVIVGFDQILHYLQLFLTFIWLA